MSTINAYAAKQAKANLEPFQINRRTPNANDVVIDIQYCGICHSDLHQVQGDWGAKSFPMVPGHEIVGTVSQVGKSVTRFKVGDKVGVGCFVDSCGKCPSCLSGEEQFCDQGAVYTYNGFEKEDGKPTFGGYSTQIVVKENYVLKLPNNLALEKAAPLLCAGITTYSPLKHYNIQPGDKVGVIGLGGLGHMAVKIANALGAEVTVFSTSENKKADALALGAKHFVNTKKADAFANFDQYFDFILNTVSADIDLTPYLNALKLDSNLVLVGAPEKPLSLPVFPLLLRRRRVGGSAIGGIAETQEMLDFCGKHHISADIELIPMQEVNEAYQRLAKGDVKFRFVIDINSIK